MIEDDAPILFSCLLKPFPLDLADHQRLHIVCHAPGRTQMMTGRHQIRREPDRTLSSADGHHLHVGQVPRGGVDPHTGSDGDLPIQ